MNLFQALILGIVQGLTEFLPISSSAHLVLVPWWLGWPEPDMVFVTTLHLGTILAVIAVFYRDLWEIIVAWLRFVFHRGPGTPKAWLGWWIILGTVPAVIVGVKLESFFESMFGNPTGVAVLLLVTGVILVTAEYFSRRRRTLDELTWVDALIIGFAQAVAILPGISRSGATISAGLWRGLKRDEAARFSFLLAVPIILGTGLKKLAELVLHRPPLGEVSLLAVGFVVAAVVGYLAVRFLLRYLQRGRLYPFAVYCWLVGIVSLVIVLLGWA